MDTNEEKKALVKQRYSELALNSDALKSGCCCGVNPITPSKKGLYNHERRLQRA